MLQLKQQQLQSTILQTRQEHEKVRQAADACEKKMSAYRAVRNDPAGVNIVALSQPEAVKTTTKNIAGIAVPLFGSVTFPQATYSLFGTPPWVDQALNDLREHNRHLAEMAVIERGLALLQAELKKVMQRVNLFEKIIIPETRKNIRRIRIALGDRMTAAVVRAKIAKKKLEEKEREGRMEAAST